MADMKADDPKAGADVGKIVNLMAGDANRVRSIFEASPMSDGDADPGFLYGM